MNKPGRAAALTLAAVLACAWSAACAASGGKDTRAVNSQSGGSGGGGSSAGPTATPSEPVRVGEGTVELVSSADYLSATGHDFQTENGQIPFLIMRENGRYTVRPVRGIGQVTWTDTLVAQVCSFEIESVGTATISGTANRDACTMEVTISATYSSGTVKSQANCPGQVEPVWPGGASTFGPAQLELYEGASVSLGSTPTYMATLTLRNLWLDDSFLCFAPETVK